MLSASEDVKLRRRSDKDEDEDLSEERVRGVRERCVDALMQGDHVARHCAATSTCINFHAYFHAHVKPTYLSALR